MAGIVSDPQIFSQAWIISMFRAQPIEQMNHLAGRLEKTCRLGFEPELKFAPGLSGQTADMFDAFPEMSADEPQLFGGGYQFLETAGDGADASGDVTREELGKEIEQQVRVRETRLGSPIR